MARTTASAAVDEVSRFGVVELEDFPPDPRERVGVLAGRTGFVPNIFRGLARRPAELRAFLDYHDALMNSEDGLSRAERELIVVATSGANHCTNTFPAMVLALTTTNASSLRQLTGDEWRARIGRAPQSLMRSLLGYARRQIAVLVKADG